MTQQPFAGAIAPGSKLGKYDVQEQVAVGGMAAIYKAYDASLDRAVAIKQIAPHLAQDERFVERFRAEAQTLARISSTNANIVNVHEMIEQDGNLFLVMEFVEGTTLRAMMDRSAVPLQTGLGILLSTALGLKAMHSQGIVHRDLKPSNIMMARDGALKITDFGLIGHSGGRTSLPMGTTKYMAPEMFTGAPVDPRADIYSLGFIAYEMFAGPEKFAEVFRDVLRDEKAQQVRWMHWHSNPVATAPSLKEVQPGIPPLIIKIVDRMMEKDASRRFASADQIIRWLRRIFVMHVKGQSLSLSDSKSLEREIEADAASTPNVPAVPTPTPTPVAGAAPGAAAPAAASRMPAAPAQPAAGPAVPVESGEKTAPLPVSKWTWQRAAKWAAIIAGPLLAIAVSLLIWDGYREAGIRRRAREQAEIAEKLYQEHKWAETIAAYTKVGKEYSSIFPDVGREAEKRTKMAEAEMALDERKYAEADAAIERASMAGADPMWTNNIRRRATETRQIEQRLSQAKQAEDTGDFNRAINILSDLARDFGRQLQDQYGVDVGARIAELQDRISMAKYREYMTRAKAAFDSNLFDQGMQYLQAARKIRETPEVMDMIEEVKQTRQLRELYAAAEAAAAEGRWAAAVEGYDKVLAIRASDTVKAKRDRARAELLADQARTFQQAGLTEQAVEKWTEVLAIQPQHAEALQAVQAFNREGQLTAQIKVADDAMREGKWEEAIRGYEAAMRLMDASHPEYARLGEQIVEAKYQMYEEKAEQLMARKDWDAAVLAIDQAREVRDTAKLATLEDRVARLKNFYLHFDIARQLVSRQSYIEARKEAQLAEQVLPSQEVRDLIVDIDYRRYMAQGKYYLGQDEVEKARAMFLLAKDKKQTPEVAAMIDECDRLLTDTSS